MSSSPNDAQLPSLALTVAGSEPATVSLVSISKTFAGVKALRDVSITFTAGQIHGVLGENGAGKSTLFKILSGFHSPDRGGELYVNGLGHRLPLTPTSSAELGFAFVHQDLGLAESLTVMENVCVGAMVTTPYGRIDWRRQGKLVSGLIHSLGIDIAPSALAGSLTQAEKAVVAIARGLYAHGRQRPTLLVLDEPTANLAPHERDRLFTAMRRVAGEGTAVVFCTHRLDEVLAVTTDVSVLRDGRLVANHRTCDVSGQAQLVTEILGRELEEFYPTRADTTAHAPVLTVTDLRGHAVRNLSLTVSAGEIVGITGMAGSGQDSVPGLIVGAEAAHGGSVSVAGCSARSLNPRTAVAAGIGYLPADRKRQSGLMNASIRENLTLASLPRFSHRGRLDHRAERAEVYRVMEQFDVRPRDNADRPLSALSGGNQQKVLLGKWLSKPGLRCMILHEPTQGVDVGAKKSILGLIAELAKRGIAVLMISSEPEELSALCDRVLTMHGGAVTSELHKPSPERISESCYLT